MGKFNLENYKDENGSYDLREVPVDKMEDVYKALSTEDMITVNESVMDSLTDIFPEDD